MMAIQYYDAGDTFRNILAMTPAMNNMTRDREMRNYLAANGAGVMSGDPAALAGLAQHDVGLAFGMQRQMDADARAKAAAGRDEQLFQKQMEEYARKMSAEEAEQEQQQTRRAIQVLSMADAPDKWDALVGGLVRSGDIPQDEAQALVGQFDNRETIIRGAMTWDQFLEERKGPQAQSTPGKVQADINAGLLSPETPLREPADAYERYVREEQAAGRQPLSRIDFSKAQQKSSRINVSPDGTVTVAEGSAAEGSDGGPLSTGGFIDAIDGALGDPALDWSVGAMKWTQVLPGTPMARFKTRVDQLSGQAFMQARQALKGGGQITDFEGSRAEAAIARLSDSQGPQDYRDALMELRTILIKGMQRERGWIDTKAGQIMNMSAADIDGLDFTKMTPDEVSAARERLMQIAKYEE